MTKRFRHDDYDILHHADANNRRTAGGRYWPSDDYMKIELLVDIRNLLYELNNSFAKLANPIMIAQDNALEKVDNSKLAVQPSHKAE